MALTEQQKNACREYLVDYRPVAAMERSGYAKSTARKNSGAFFSQPEVAQYLADLARDAAAANDLTPARVLKEITRIAFADLTSFYKFHPTKKRWVLKSLDELSEDQRACVAEYKPGVHMKLHSKDGALDKLGKHFKLYTDIDASTNNLFLLPAMTLDGRPVKFQVGKPAPKVSTKS